MKEMKNKKGFTLVELLAVIAILAILVIMALPAVLRMYRQSRISSFQNEVRTVYRTAQSQFLSDSMLLESGQTIAYTNAGTSVTGVNVVKELDMTGNTDFKYYVLINIDGKILNVRASNGTYSFSKQAVDAEHDLKIEDIDVETNNDSTLDSNITTTVCPVEEVTYVVEIVHVSSVEINEKDFSVPIANVFTQLSVTILPENAENKNVTWSSSDESIATVDQDGLVTFVNTGTVTITVVTEDGSKTDTSIINITYRGHSGGNI